MQTGGGRFESDRVHAIHGKARQCWARPGMGYDLELHLDGESMIMARHKKDPKDNIPAGSGRGGRHEDDAAIEVELIRTDGAPNDWRKFRNQKELDDFMVKTGNTYKDYKKM